MESSQCIHAPNGNYHLYLFPAKSPELILLSSLDDALYHFHLTQQSIPASAINMFGQVQELYHFLAAELGNKEKIVVSDLGLIQISELFEVKNRKIKMETQLQTRKVADRDEAYQFMLMIVRKLSQKRQQVKKERKKLEFEDVKKPMQQIQWDVLKFEKDSLIERPISKAQRIFLSIDQRENDADSLSSFTKVKNNLYQISKALPSRIKIYFNQTIPQNQCVFFTIKVIKKQGRALALGLIDKREIKGKGTSATSYSFEFATGQIKDCGSHLDSKETKWRKQGKASINLQTVLKVIVDKPQRRVIYQCRGQKVGESFLNDYMMKAEIVPYLNCQNQGDLFFLNAD